ncbi:yjeF C-terminal region, hydroxyethylthiazole kinase-related [Streptococcus equinus]|uniref:ADP-dependent (S)-NAD(P)H-hydrate dehydratase n=1 Tax=Streptococcus equinus TaxID=1335 RepID=A0A1H0LTY1_STREI|nr:NAD(P)H-hydrate dehydratase [Streptococcus equinus]SDO71624.1 yjeF C-terminal region, hydroxyethylthiazole kinase-related [Streptococcus equinus]
MIIDEQLARQVVTKRQANSHKGTYGRVLLIGGFYPYGGAIIMSALACVKSGAGLVTVATERDNITALHAHLPETMAFDCEDKELFEENLTKADVVLVGPGLSENSKASRVFEKVLETISEHQILIIDGSALNLLAKMMPVSFNTKHLVLTPHQKEWERLSGLVISEQTVGNTRKVLEAFPEETILVAKSHHTKIFQGQALAELTVGGPYQATGGMGDTLCGMIAGFVAQFKENLFDTVAVATYLHSAIADKLSHEAYVVLPTTISAELPKVMKQLSE